MKNVKAISLNSKVLFIISTIVMVSVGCAAQSDLQKLCRSLGEKKATDTEWLYSKIKSSRKESIPYLIDIVGVQKKGFVGFQDFKSSVFYPVHENYCGIRAAYMIERILANQDEKKLFNLCVIVRLKDNQAEMKALSYDDMKDIQKIYGDWWEENKLKSVLELSQDWNDGHRPLTGSIYVWK